jgi:phage tail sheath gpL-like
MNELGFVLELSPTDKVPGIYLRTLFGLGGASSGTEEKVLLIVGLKAASGGTITADADVVDIRLDSDADYYFGAGSEAARMCYAALSVSGIKIKAASPSISGAVAASAVITIDGTWTTAGTWRYRIAGITLQQGILPTDSKQNVAEAIAAYINTRKWMPVSAVAAVGVGTDWKVTLSAKSAGARGNDLIIVQNTTELPSGCTSTITAGTAVGNGGKRFTSGSGVEDITDLLEVLASDRYYRIAAAQRDATNLARWVVQLDTKAGPTIGKTEHIIFAGSGTLVATTSLTQVTLNEQRAQFVWMQDGETQPCEIAALHAAQRLQAEQSNPNQSYDNKLLKGNQDGFAVYPQTDKATNPVRSVLVAALDAGITPVKTIGQNTFIVRAMTTRSRTELGAVDSGTIDVADSAVPDAVRDEIAAFWSDDFAVKNKHVRDDPSEDEPEPPEGIAYPRFWKASVTMLLKSLERAKWLTKVDQNPVEAVLHPDAERIVFFCPVVRLPHQHQIEGTIAQKRFSATVNA